MWLPLKALARLFVTTAAVLTIIAITLGRYGIRQSDNRRMVPLRYQPVNIHLFQPHHNDLLMLDVETGMTEQIPIADSQVLKYASCSPWQDRWGRTHLVALWMGRSSPDKELAIGLTRYALPGREVLDRVEMDVLPASSPCWSPDTTARILFAGLDGQLYRFSFEGSRGLDPADNTPRPRPLLWKTKPPAGLIAISAPNWPADPRLGGKILAAATFAHKEYTPQLAPRRESQTELWWLQLSRDGSAIMAAGPLISKEPADSAERMTVEDLPVISTLSDGRLLLAYLVCGESESHYRLRLAPLTIQGPSSLPSAKEQDAVEFSGKFLLSPPAFSGDGRWLYAIPHSAQRPIRVERFSVADALAKQSTQVAVTEPTPTPITIVSRLRTK